MKNLSIINIERENKTTQLINDCKMFFAFSEEQFESSKTELQEGEKYISLGMGTYISNGNIEKWKKGILEIENWKREQIKNNNLEESEILFELRNYECFYTGDIEDVENLFINVYSTEEIINVYNKHKNNEDC